MRTSQLKCQSKQLYGNVSLACYRFYFEVLDRNRCFVQPLSLCFCLDIGSQCTFLRLTGRRSSLKPLFNRGRTTSTTQSASFPSSFWSRQDSRATFQQLLFMTKVRKSRRRREERKRRQTATAAAAILAHWSLWIIEK